MLPIPELNEERRRDLTKVAGDYAERARVSVRNLRRDGMDQIKKAKADGLSEDDQKFWESTVQEMTDATSRRSTRRLRPSKQRLCKSDPKGGLFHGQGHDTTRPRAAHVAIIMDGNGRWAQQRGRPRLFGHHAVRKRVREIVESCPDLGVKYLTIFAFSTENWKRTQAEVAGLMRLFRRYIEREAKALFEDGVRVRFIGDRIKLDAKLVTLMDNLELYTATTTRCI